LERHAGEVVVVDHQAAKSHGRIVTGLSGALRRFRAPIRGRR